MSRLPDTVADLDLAVVVDVLSRNAVNVTDAAADLGVPASDLRRLLWANPRLQDEAFEQVEARLDLAEKNVMEALKSDDPRRRDAASFFALRNTARAKRRGWITSASAGADLSINSNEAPRRIIISWKGQADPEDEEDEQLQNGRVIEHEAGPASSNED